VSRQGNATCTCKPGWSGEFCRERVHVCSEDVCSGQGSCTYRDDGRGGFTEDCHCNHGYTGYRCTVDQVDQMQKKIAQRDATIAEKDYMIAEKNDTIKKLKDIIQQFISNQDIKNLVDC